jgi:hypothetical protein
MTFNATNLNGAHPRIAPGAPASGTAGVEFSQKSAGTEIGAPFVFVYFAVHHAAVLKLIG